jgi:hypothetical protein
MANALFPLGKQAFLSGSINMTSDTIKVALVKTTSGYTYSAAHQFYSDLTPASNVVGTPATLGTITVTTGIFDAADTTFTSVSGSAVGALVLYKDTGAPTTSPLIAYIDTATGLPVTPNGGNISIVYDNSTNKIFAL